ncbi:sensor histidine kinase [Mucilaginibacter agri]|uniref:histidine kinase n=1 Tax=Mucilaginibacter agri TaxID=2695265 RepID=A0A965ZIS4_9SPHI|nr:PAS domain S-box protein [Mucilaginibacter agri]NCD70842.1 PAS domain S-box protein [Mucilaginibacter agri]
MHSSDVQQSLDQKLLQLLVASVKDYAIFMIDPQGYIMSWNQGAERTKGYTEEEAIGRHISIFYTPEDQVKGAPMHNLALALKHGSHESEGWRVRKDGSKFWADVVFTPLYDDNHKHIGFAKVTRDITERKQEEDRKLAANVSSRKQAEESLIRSEANLRSVFENTDVAILLMDSDLRIMAFNQNAYNFCLDKNNKELKIGDSAYNAFRKARESINKNIHKQVLNGETISYEASYIPTEGPVEWYEVKWFGVRNKDKIVGVIITIKDITVRKQLEIDRDKITTDLVQRNKDLEQFAYIVSHNLRAPVANIVGLSNMLSTLDPDEQERASICESIATAIHNLDNVVVDLNTILQVDGQVIEQPEPVSLQQLVREVEIGIGDLIRDSHATLLCDFEAIDTLTMRKGYLHSIFHNLIVNGIKYRRDNAAPVIKISSRIANGNIVIIFKDNGKGIDLSTHSSRLFGLYQRFDTSVDGKGMGLFMVKTQVETLGGTIEVESKLNQGTKFLIEFPMEKSDV